MKIMKSIVLMVMIMISAQATMAQRNHNRGDQKVSKEELATLQAKRIANSLALDEATSQKLVETYVAYQKEVIALGFHKNHNKNESLTDEQVEQNIKEKFAETRAILNLREKYYKVYRTFLTPKQIQRVYEEEKKMMDRLSRHGGKTGKKAEKGQKNNDKQNGAIS